MKGHKARWGKPGEKGSHPPSANREDANRDHSPALPPPACLAPSSERTVNKAENTVGPLPALQLRPRDPRLVPGPSSYASARLASPRHVGSIFPATSPQLVLNRARISLRAVMAVLTSLVGGAAGACADRRVPRPDDNRRKVRWGCVEVSWLVSCGLTGGSPWTTFVPE